MSHPAYSRPSPPMTLIQSHDAATHPPCKHLDGMPCESCNELTEIEAQIGDLQDSDRLEDLHERHRLARFRRNHVHSPLIHGFPLEIVTHIFTLAFPPRDQIPCYNPSQRLDPLILAKVCHTWRVLTLSIPNLWCDISVDAGNPNFPFLNHQVAHSGMLPLSIHLYRRSNKMHKAKQAVSFVIKQLHRTASFCYRDSADFPNLFDSDLDYPKAAPLLDVLHVRTRTDLYESD